MASAASCAGLRPISTSGQSTPSRWYLASRASCFWWPAGRRFGGQGNVILLTEGELGVAEACSGLRMMMLFVTVCVGAAFVMKSGFWVKVLVVLSAVPIALAANVMRITVTGVLYQVASHNVAEAVYHDLAGWIMMPLAVVLLWAEMELLHRLATVPEEEDVGML